MERNSGPGFSSIFNKVVLDIHLGRVKHAGTFLHIIPLFAKHLCTAPSKRCSRPVPQEFSHWGAGSSQPPSLSLFLPTTASIFQKAGRRAEEGCFFSVRPFPWKCSLFLRFHEKLTVFFENGQFPWKIYCFCLQLIGQTLSHVFLWL